jgi:AcrR family transcriptional regulator
MADVATRAAVSKALVLYHFHDKESLLVALVDEVGRLVVSRERAAIDQAGAANPLDAYWRWLERELAAGDIRTLLALGQHDSERVRAACRRVARERRELAAQHVGALFERLALSPRIPPALLAETVVAFVDGLSAATGLDPAANPRPAFDALWLALLTLTE